MKKQEIKVYTILLISKSDNTENSVIAVASYPTKERANEHAKRQCEFWKPEDNVPHSYEHKFSADGLVTSSYYKNGQWVLTYKVQRTQLFI